MGGLLARRRLRGAVRGRRLVLYSTPGCHLCEDAAALLRRLGIPYHAEDASGDPERFLRVPVIEMDGLVIAEGRVDEEALTRGLRG